MANNVYTNDAQQRMLRLIDRLIGHEVWGINAVDLAVKIDASQSTVFRDLKNLEEAGWAEQMPDGRWRLSVNAAKLLRRINDGIAAALTKVNEARRSYQEF